MHHEEIKFTHALVRKYIHLVLQLLEEGEYHNA